MEILRMVPCLKPYGNENAASLLMKFPLAKLSATNGTYPCPAPALYFVSVIPDVDHPILFFYFFQAPFYQVFISLFHSYAVLLIYFREVL